MILNAHDTVLLTALRRGNHFKANPGDVAELFDKSFVQVGPSERLSSARRLSEAGLAAFVRDSEMPGRVVLGITDAGIAYADNHIEENRVRTWTEWLASITRSDWIAIGAFIVSLIALFKN